MTHTWTDSYPYNANSTFALHPMYLRLSELGRLKDEARQKYFDDLGAELNALKQVDYERVNNAKNKFTREIFRQEGEKTLASPEFKDFVEANVTLTALPNLESGANMPFTMPTRLPLS